MTANRTEPDATARPAPRPTAQQPSPPVRAAGSAPADERVADPRAGETIDEPGYGHGV